MAVLSFSSSSDVHLGNLITVTALQHLRRMRGGAQSHLMRCSDGGLYVVKFQNNPQHIRILANELIVTRLATALDLPVPEAAIVEVDRWLIDNTPELEIQLQGTCFRCKAGIHFGSHYAVDPLCGHVFDFLPEALFERVQDSEVFAGMLALDKWVGNTDSRQAVFGRRSIQKKYRVAFVDHGYSFNGGDWNFPDHRLKGVYSHRHVYKSVVGWHSFEPWLSRLESFSDDVIWSAADVTPPEWYQSDWAALEELLRTLCSRRAIVRELIAAFRASECNPFPNWTESPR